MQSLSDNLARALELIPPDWKLVPVKGKRPIGRGWNERPYTPLQLSTWIASNRCTGFGLLTGTQVNEGHFVLAVDQDGAVAALELEELCSTPLPKTVGFTSGRPGRCQWLLEVPGEIAPTLHTHKLKGGLELRWTGLVSVLPPSIHPKTRKPYRWLPGCSPGECAIAVAPDWLVQLMSAPATGATETTVQQLVPTRPPLAPVTSTDPIVAYLLSLLAPWRVDDYREWIRVGMALKSHSEELLPLWDAWSRQSPKYKPGECASKWRSFNPTRISIDTLYYLAGLDSNSRTRRAS